MKRKVYVMDCGDFIKIGVSSDPARRVRQIPYSVLRFTESQELHSKDAFALEGSLHWIFQNERKDDASGREYFNVPFELATQVLTQQLEAMELEPEKKTGFRFFKDKDRESLAMKVISLLKYADDFDLGYMLGTLEAKRDKEQKEDFFWNGIYSMAALNESDLMMALSYITALRDKENADSCQKDTGQWRNSGKGRFKWEEVS
nr:MAG TPA: hypothetical protein [Caudoviricetes sp.]